MTEKNHIESFLLMLRSEKGLSKNTVEAYRSDLAQVQQKFDLAGADESKLRGYLNLLSLDHRSVARKISSLRQFYHFMMRNKSLPKNPMDNIIAPKIQAPLPKILTKEEVENIMKSASSKDLRVYTMLEILYATGLRITELVSLKRTNFSYYETHPVLLVKGKGSKERIVPLNKKAHTALKEYLSKVAGVWMFPSSSAQGYLTRQRLGQLLKDIAMMAGVDPQKVSPHILRHAFATHMLQNGADLMLIKEILGHKNLSTSEIYLHVLPNDLKDLVEQYHPAKGMLTK